MLKNISKVKQNKETKFNNKFRSIILIAVILITFIAYYNAIQNDFVNWDDNEYLLENNDIKDLSIHNIKNIFSSFYVNNYQPFTMLTYAIEYKLSGLNPAVYHLNNIILHLINTLLVFYFIFLLTSRFEIASVVSLLFAVHPMHVESVTWIAERKDVLYSLFYLGSLISYIFYKQKGLQTKFYIFSIVLFIFSLLSKSMAVTLPIVLMLIDYFNSKQLLKKINFSDKIPYLCLSLIFGLVALQSQEAAMNLVTYTFLDKIFFFCYSLCFYVFKLIIPIGLSALHPYPIKSDGALPVVYYLSPVLFILLLLLIWKHRKKQDLIFGCLFFIITIAPVLQIISVGRAVVSERYTYISYLGFFLIIGRTYCNMIEKDKKYFRKIKRYANIILAAYAIMLLILTIQRNKAWKDSITLFTDIIEQYPYTPIPYGNIGVVKKIYNDHKGALYYFNKAIELDSLNVNNLNNRAILKKDMKDYAGAFADFNKAVKLSPDDASLYNNRGDFNMQLRDYQSALKDFNKAINLNSSEAKFYSNRGIANKALNNLKAAQQDFQKAIALQPLFAASYTNLGNLNMELKNYKEALIYFDKSISIDPNMAKTYFNRGSLKMNLKDTEGALLDFDKAIASDSTYTDAYNSRGVIKTEMKNFKEALLDFTKAIEKNKNFPEAYSNRGVSHTYIQDYPHALSDFTKAIELDSTKAMYYLHRGIIYQIQNKIKEACNDWHKATDLGLNDANILLEKNCK